MSDGIVTVKLDTTNSQVRKHLERIVHDSEGFELQAPDETKQTDLLILEVGCQLEDESEFIDSLPHSDVAGEVFVTSENCNQGVLLAAMRAGVKEFLPQPIKEDEVRQALERYKERKEKGSKLGQVIDIIGSKGGIGTTTVAVNLAFCLAEKKDVEKVALVDLNPLFGEVPDFLEMKPRYHWGEIIENISRLDKTYLEQVLTRHSSGLYVLPAPASLNGDYNATPENLQKILKEMKKTFDFVVIDGGRSFDVTSLKVANLSTRVFIVTVLTYPCLSNAKKLTTSLLDKGYQSENGIEIIVNRYLKKSDISLKDAESAISRKIFWTIPNDYRKTLSAINRGKALSEVTSRAPIARSLSDLAQALLPRRKNQGKRRWGLLRRS